MLVIFVVETTSSNRSDQMYITKLYETFYEVENKTKIDWVYLNGKGNYNKKTVLKKTKDKITKYHRNNHNSSIHVFYCIDVDGDNSDNKKLNDNISSFCESNNYRVIWFKRTIEEVFIGKKVCQGMKKKEAIAFSKKPFDIGISFINNSSNIIKELDSILKRKNY